MALLIRKLMRYGAVSLVATATSLTVLGVLVGTRVDSPVWANVVATAVGTVPSFELNRRWVWRKAGGRSLAAEILPFCALSFAGLVLSTVTVAAAARWANDTGFTGSLRTVAVELANVSAFGALWVIQFVVLDRLLFVAPRHDARSPVVSE
jgi:putative flippase GtrA